MLTCELQQHEDQIDLRKGNEATEEDIGAKCDFAPSTNVMNVLSGINADEMMTLLAKDPTLQLQLLNLVNAYNSMTSIQEGNKGTNTVISESSQLIEKVTSECGDTEKKTQVVMSPSQLPESRPTYAMNMIADGKQSVTAREMSVAVPAEHTLVNSVMKCAISDPDVDVPVTEECTSPECVVPRPTTSSISLTLNADEIKNCKKAKPFPIIVEPVDKICSDQDEFDSFINMISPEYAFSESQNSQGLDEIFESWIAQPSLSQSIPTECVISSKASSPVMESNMASPDSSICDDSDLENDALENWNCLKDLQNIIERVGEGFAINPASPVSSVYDLESLCGDMSDIADLTDDECSVDSVNDVVSTIIAASPSRDGYSLDNALPGSELIQLCVPEQFNNQPLLTHGAWLSQADVCIENPVTVVTSNTLGRSLPNVVVSQRSPLGWFQGEEIVEVVEDIFNPPKRQKHDESLLAESVNVGFNGGLEKPWVDETQVDVINRLLHENHPVFKRDDEGDIALHISVAKEEVETSRKLIELMKGDKLDAQNGNNQAPLHLACYNEDIPHIHLLLESGASPDFVDADGNNMAHIACMKGSKKILNKLMEFYVKDPCKVMKMLDECNYEGLTPLHIACQKNDTKMVDCLLMFNCNLDGKDMKAGMTALAYSLKYGNWELADQLIVNGANVNVPTNAGWYPLDLVGLSDNLTLAKDLISRNAESGVKIEFVNKEMKNLFESELRRRRRKRNREASRKD